MHGTIPKGNMGYDQYTVSDDLSCPKTGLSIQLFRERL